MYAIGGNANGARRAGIRVRRVRLLVFMLSGALASIGALVAVSNLGAADTTLGGGTLLLEAIAAAVIGGVSLFGGRGTVWAAVFGSLVIAASRTASTSPAARRPSSTWSRASSSWWR